MRMSPGNRPSQGIDGTRIQIAPDHSNSEAEDQQQPTEACVISVHADLLYFSLNRCIWARKVASGVTPTCCAATLPSLKMSRAGIEEIP
jgi:hypothetical protein